MLGVKTDSALSALQTEFIEAGFPTRVHEEGNRFERSRFIRRDQNRYITIHFLDLLEEIFDLILGHNLSIKGHHTLVIDTDCHGALELIFARRLYLW